jgi:mono/diheme cytochrome c family protein
MKIHHGICIAAAGIAVALAQAPSEKAASIPTDGALLYATYCVDCHGKDARGSGPMAATLSAKVPDLTRLAARNGGVFPVARVEGLLSAKTVAAITHGGLAMPTWGLVFSGGDPGSGTAKQRAHNLARYLETLQK